MSRPSQYIKPSDFESSFISLLLKEDNNGCGKESQTVNESLEALATHYKEPFSRSSKDIDLAAKFHDLKHKWEKETSHLSATTQIAMHPAYQKIIGMGKDVLPLIMQELALRPNHWFWALWSWLGWFLQRNLPGI